MAPSTTNRPSPSSPPAKSSPTLAAARERERIREEARHTPTAQAVRCGLTATGRVITTDGLVLAGTFAALQIPDVTVAEVGIAVALGVLIDTLLVRALQVPALVTLLAERTWWPTRRRTTPPPP
ncbi:MMPL family transporter [Spirillospora sp. CA-128828]|uniref:MMPL family transporter n=1 Tax=Spirillospora sp. CA-128828 TaxID=3240033 RepID=UPI003D92D230